MRISDWFRRVLFRSRFGEARDDFVGHTVGGDATGVLEAAEDQARSAFVVADDELLDLVVDRRFNGRAEARTHVDAVGAKRECGCQTATITDSAAGDHRNLDRKSKRLNSSH